MNKSVLYFAILSLLSISCNKDPNIMTVVNEIDFKNNTQQIINGKTVKTIIGANNIVIFDSLLLIHTTNPAGQLQVYSSNTLDSLGSFCTKGRAKNEFIRASMSTEQAYYKDGHIILVMFDVPDVFKEVDVTASLQNHSTVVINTVNCLSLAEGEIKVLGNDYNTRYEYVRNIYYGKKDKIARKVPTKYLLYNNGKKKELHFFRSLMKSEIQKATIPYLGSLYKHPKKNIVVQSFQRLDYLLFMDFDTDSYFAIHQKGSLSFNDTFKREDDTNVVDVLHFTEGAVSSDYIMLLYWYGDYTRSQECVEEEKCPELLIFDWSGNYITGFKLDRYVRSIEYDEKHKVLYGFGDEDLYAFDMVNLLP